LNRDSVSDITKSLTNWINRRPFLSLLLIIGFCLVLLVSRQPDAIFHPQLWAEDGTEWLKGAHDSGLVTLFRPYAGSLQVFMRFIGLIAAAFPLKLVPLLFALAALFIQILPIILIHSKRFKVIFSQRWFVWAITIFYLAQPNTIEVHANLTNSNWHLAISAILILIAPVTRSAFWVWSDRIILILASLTGPFGLFLLPIIVIRYLNTHDSSHKEKLILITIFTILQLVVLIQAPTSGTFDVSTPLHNKSQIMQIIGGQLVGTTILGHNAFGTTKVNSAAASWLFFWFLISTSIALYRGPSELRLFILFGLIVMAASLFRDQDNNLVKHWANLASGQGGRYMYIPSLVWMVSIFSLLGSNNWFLRSGVLVTVFSVFMFAIPLDFRIPPRDKSNFNEFATQFERSSRGEKVCNDVNPVTPTHRWKLCLVK
jgi:hypothetical protein